jgi:hypothetical protein
MEHSISGFLGTQGTKHARSTGGAGNPDRHAKIGAAPLSVRHHEMARGPALGEIPNGALHAERRR